MNKDLLHQACENYGWPQRLLKLITELIELYRQTQDWSSIRQRLSNLSEQEVLIWLSEPGSRWHLAKIPQQHVITYRNGFAVVSQECMFYHAQEVIRSVVESEDNGK